MEPTQIPRFTRQAFNNLGRSVAGHINGTVEYFLALFDQEARRRRLAEDQVRDLLPWALAGALRLQGLDPDIGNGHVTLGDRIYLLSVIEADELVERIRNGEFEARS